MASTTVKSYRVRRKLEAFYTGGAARLSQDGSLLACACADEVKVVDVASGAVLRTIEGVSRQRHMHCAYRPLAPGIAPWTLSAMLHCRCRPQATPRRSRRRRRRRQFAAAIDRRTRRLCSPSCRIRSR